MLRRRCLCFSIQSSMHLTSHSLIQTQPFFLFGWSFIEPAIEAAIDPMSHCLRSPSCLRRPTATASSARLSPPPDCDCLFSSTASAARLRLPPQLDCLRRTTTTASAARLPPPPDCDCLRRATSAARFHPRRCQCSRCSQFQSIQSMPIDTVDRASRVCVCRPMTLSSIQLTQFPFTQPSS
jgi:hypothetical protein